MINKGLMVLGGALLFIGCGGSGTTATIEDGISKGTYVDSEVNGVRYVCGNQSGTTGDTGADGGFRYQKGEPCTFSINGIELSKVSGDKLNVDKVQIRVGDDDVAVFLQSLDMDGNATNGITIDSKVVDVLARNGKATLPKTPSEVQEIAGLLSSAGIGYAGEAVSKKDAQKHMAGFSLSMSATKLEMLEGDEVSFAADVEGDKDGLTYEWVGYGETSSYFTKDDFSAGEHTIVVNVTKGGITLSASQTIKVTANSEFIVSIVGGQSNYNTEDDVMLEANTTGNIGNSPTYVWNDNGNNLNVSTKSLSKKFGAGSHSVTVDVTGNGVTKSASFDFNVSDLGNFEISTSTIAQKEEGLMWVNSDDKQYCLAIHGDTHNETIGDGNFENAKTFCNRLTLDGFTNWRTPTSKEIQNYIIKTNEANIQTSYAGRTCPQLLSTIEGATDYSDGANYRAVTTRYRNQEYRKTLGEILTHNYTSSTENYLKYNVGLRCVRNTDGSGGEDIPGANISVSIAAAKASYIVGEDVNLTANVTGATTISSYSWKENGVEIETSAKLSKNDFNVGSHTITLHVEADEFNKSKSVTFDIVNAPDLSDFNITSLTANKDEVIIHNGLMWVNESNASKGKCAKIHGNDANHTTRYETEFTNAKTFCSSINGFAGFSGWRTPTVSELSGFIRETVEASILTNYDAPCKKLLAIKRAGDNVDDNSSYTTVSTRHDKNKTPGTESNMDPNIGLRCVRTHQ